MCFSVYCYVFFFLFCVFFQAEDGIRDLVRSRGLGDVYKRQAKMLLGFATDENLGMNKLELFCDLSESLYDIYRPHIQMAVSYTHLTLPTSDLV